MLPPSAVLGVYTDAADAATAARFGHMEDTFREKLLDVMRHEDAVLRRYMDKNRLEDWCRTAKEGAEKAVQAEMDRLTEMQGADVAAGQHTWKLLGPHGA